MPSVLIQDITPRDQYTATAGQTVFIYSFTLFDASDIEVYKRADKDVEADDYSQKLQLNIDYTVDLNASTITLLVACSGEEIVTLVRNMQDERLNLYINGAVITADALNTDQESSVLMIQQNSMYDTVLTPHYNKSEIIDDTNPQGGDIILPILGPGQTWAKDPTDNFIEAVSIGGGGGGDVQMLNPGTTGQFQGSVARWNSSGVLTDSVVNITDSGSMTGGTDATIGNVRIGVTDPGTIDTTGSNPLTIKAAAGQLLTLGELGANTALNGLTLPTADGTAGQVLTTDGAGNLSFAAGGGGAPFASTKYNLVQFSNTTGGLQDSGIDYQAGVLSGMTEVDVGNLEISGNTIASGNANGNITLAPNGTGQTVSEKNLVILSGSALAMQNPANTFTVSLSAGALTKTTNYIMPLEDGAAGEVLTTDGAGNLSFGTGGGGGGGNWVQVGTTTAANSATVDLVSVFSASYTRYMIVARNVTFQTATADFWARVGTGVTPTWKSGASDYAYAGDGFATGGALIQPESAAAAQILLASSVSSSTDSPASFILNIFDPTNVAYKTPIIGQVQSRGSANLLEEISIAGRYLTAEAVSSIRFLASSGNIVTGEFEVYGFNPNGGGGGGSIPSNVVQTVTTSDSTMTSGAIPETSVKITPSSSTSRIKYTASFCGAAAVGGPGFVLYRNGVALTVSGKYIGVFRISDRTSYTFTYIDSPATTLEVDYKLGGTGGPYTCAILGDISSSFIVEEIGAA